MTEQRKVLVTGATGRLGSAVCKALVECGHEVRATDQRFAAGALVRVELGDLRDEWFAHRVIEGCDTVVHLANHPNGFVGISAQRLLAENVAINANVFLASVNLGVSCLVFASSIQVMLRTTNWFREKPYAIPYLPLDGQAPPDPGTNPYALSKEFAERMLRIQTEQQPTLSATALRLPMLTPEPWLKRLTSRERIPADFINYGECGAFLQLPDAGTLVAAVIERRLPGYHQYLPAAHIEIRNRTIADLVCEHYAHVPLRRPVEALESLIDLGEVTRDLGWTPQNRLSVELE
jgi:nucleoside-diphosphate-sugar epimerase